MARPWVGTLKGISGVGDAPQATPLLLSPEAAETVGLLEGEIPSEVLSVPVLPLATPVRIADTVIQLLYPPAVGRRVERPVA